MAVLKAAMSNALAVFDDAEATEADVKAAEEKLAYRGVGRTGSDGCRNRDTGEPDRTGESEHRRFDSVRTPAGTYPCSRCSLRTPETYSEISVLGIT